MQRKANVDIHAHHHTEDIHPEFIHDRVVDPKEHHQNEETPLAQRIDQSLHRIRQKGCQNVKAIQRRQWDEVEKDSRDFEKEQEGNTRPEIRMFNLDLVWDQQECYPENGNNQRICPSPFNIRKTNGKTMLINGSA